MRYRKLDSNGDYSFGSGQQNFTYGTYAVAQAIKTSLALLKGEWWENLSIGLPLFQGILGQPGTLDNIAIVDSLFKSVITGVVISVIVNGALVNLPNAVSIQDFVSTYENRVYTFTCNVTTPFGVTTVTL